MHYLPVGVTFSLFLWVNVFGCVIGLHSGGGGEYSLFQMMVAGSSLTTVAAINFTRFLAAFLEADRCKK